MPDGRRVVQVQAYPIVVYTDRNEVSYIERCVVALCDDGSLWELTQFAPRWQRLPEIPQDG